MMLLLLIFPKNVYRNMWASSTPIIFFSEIFFVKEIKKSNGICEIISFVKMGSSKLINYLTNMCSSKWALGITAYDTHVRLTCVVYNQTHFVELSSTVCLLSPPLFIRRQEEADCKMIQKSWNLNKTDLHIHSIDLWCFATHYCSFFLSFWSLNIC
jgi:hypothetical protein